MRKLNLLCAYMPTSPELRTARQQALLEILAERPVERQSEFVALLKARGLDATQSSISRDLRQLGIAKLDAGYAQRPIESAADDIEANFIRAVETAGPNLTVVKTATGAAARVALSLDRSDWPEVVGTISGDDTIFVATKNANDQKLFLRRLPT